MLTITNASRPQPPSPFRDPRHYRLSHIRSGGRCSIPQLESRFIQARSEAKSDKRDARNRGTPSSFPLSCAIYRPVPVIPNRLPFSVIPFSFSHGRTTSTPWSNLPTLNSPANERRPFYVPMQMCSKSQKYSKTVSMHSECSASNGAELFLEFPMRIKHRIQSSQSPIRKRST